MTFREAIAKVLHNQPEGFGDGPLGLILLIAAAQDTAGRKFSESEVAEALGEPGRKPAPLSPVALALGCGQC